MQVLGRDKNSNAEYSIDDQGVYTITFPNGEVRKMDSAETRAKFMADLQSAGSDKSSMELEPGVFREQRGPDGLYPLPSEQPQRGPDGLYPMPTEREPYGEKLIPTADASQVALSAFQPSTVEAAEQIGEPIYKPKGMVGDLAQGFENVLASEQGQKALAQAFDFGVKGGGPAVAATLGGLTAEGIARFGPGGSQQIAKEELAKIEQQERQIGLVGREEERDIRASAGRAGASLQQDIEQTAAATGRLDPRQIQVAAEQAKKIQEEGVVRGKMVRSALQSQEEQQLENAKRAFQAQMIANREAFAGSIGRAMTGLAQLAGQYAGSVRGVSINRGDTASLLQEYNVDQDIIDNIGLVDQRGLEQIVLDAAGDLSAKQQEQLLKEFRADLRRQ